MLRHTQVQILSSPPYMTSKEYYWKNRKKLLADQKTARRKRRTIVLDFYGGKCYCCSEILYEFLGIDHINGGGTKHRKLVGANLDRWIIRNNFPPGFRVLCHNCNLSLGMYGYCPHIGIPQGGDDSPKVV